MIYFLKQTENFVCFLNIETILKEQFLDLRITTIFYINLPKKQEN